MKFNVCRSVTETTWYPQCFIWFLQFSHISNSVGLLGFKWVMISSLQGTEVNIKVDKEHPFNF